MHWCLCSSRPSSSPTYYSVDRRRDLVSGFDRVRPSGMSSVMASEMKWISFSRSTLAVLQLMALELLVAYTRISHPCRKHTVHCNASA
jgi:hypothetical protein